MSYDWEPEQYQRLPSNIQRARDILEDWFWAIENNTVDKRFPDPLYPVIITQELADLMIQELDMGFNSELNSWAYKLEAGAFEKGPEFWRLKPQQRIALAQQLNSVLKLGP